MPSNAVKTPRDEKRWKEAKQAAEDAGQGGNYAYVMGIYQRMKKAETGTHSDKMIANLLKRRPDLAPRFTIPSPHLEKAGPYIGPRGGMWADPKHTKPWKPEKGATAKPQMNGAEPIPPDEVEGIIARLMALSAGQLKKIKAELAFRKKNYARKGQPVPEAMSQWEAAITTAEQRLEAGEKPPAVKSKEPELRKPVSKLGRKKAQFTIAADGTPKRKREFAFDPIPEPEEVKPAPPPPEPKPEPKKPKAEKKPRKKTPKPKAKAKAKPKKTDDQKLAEVGEHIYGSRVDLAQLAKALKAGEKTLTDKDLGNMSYDDAAFLLKKQNLVPAYELETLEGMGISAGVAHASLALFSFIGAKPAENTAEGRRAYLSATRRVVKSVLNCKTLSDYEELFSELRREYRASGLIDYSPVKVVQWDRSTDYQVDQEKRRAANQELEAEARAMGLSPDEYRVVRSGASQVTLHRLVKAPVSDLEALGSRFEKVMKGRSNAYRGMLGQARMAEKHGYEYLRKTDEASKKRAEEQKKQRAEQKNTKRGRSLVRLVSGTIERKGETVAVKDANPTRVQDTFGLPNIQYGNWMTQADREHHTEALEAAYHDFSEIMGVPPKTIGLQGRLGISMGGRGRGKAAAHYESGKKIINLTKFAGGGALAHEWGHALDNVMGEILQENKAGAAGGVFLSEGHGLREAPPAVQDAVKAVNEAMNTHPGGPNPNLRKMKEAALARAKETKEQAEKFQAKRSVLRQLKRYDKDPGEAASYRKRLERTGSPTYRAYYMEALREYDAAKGEELGTYNLEVQYDALIHESISANNAARRSYSFLRKYPSNASDFRIYADILGKKYWGSTREMFARAFEANIQDMLSEQGRRNSYLVDGTDRGELFAVGAYPRGKERESINKAMRVLIDELKKAGTIQKAVRYVLDLKKAEPKFHLDLEKSYALAPTVAPQSSGGRVPGQIPGMSAVMKTFRTVPDRSAQMLDRPIMSAEGVVDGMPVDGTWRPFMRELLASGPNTVVMHKAVMLKAMETQTDPQVAKAILERANRYLSGKFQKSEPRGGKYHKRVRTEKGGYRYFYDEDSYKASKDYHHGGEEAGQAYISKTIERMFRGAGDQGVEPSSLKKMVQKYGREKVGGCLRKMGCSFDKKAKRFSLAKAVDSAPRFMIPR